MDEAGRRTRATLDATLTPPSHDTDVSFDEWVRGSYETFFTIVDADEPVWRIGLCEWHHPDLRRTMLNLRDRWVAATADA